MMIKVNIWVMKTGRLTLTLRYIANRACVLTKYNEMCLSELSHAAVIGAEVANSFFYKGNIKTRSICH